MRKNAHRYLKDIFDAIEIIFDIHLKDIHTLDEYEDSINAQDGVEKRLIIIGEAAYRLRQMGEILPQADQIINRRNTIVHQYDGFTNRTIWKTVHEDLPELKMHIEQLLNQSES